MLCWVIMEAWNPNSSLFKPSRTKDKPKRLGTQKYERTFGMKPNQLIDKMKWICGLESRFLQKNEPIFVF